MVYMVYDQMVNQAAQALVDISQMLYRVDYTRDFPGKWDLREKAGKYQEVTQNANYIRAMLRKLKPEEFLQVYRDCRELATKYKLPSKRGFVSGGSVEVPHAAITMGDDLYIDIKYPDGSTLPFFSCGWDSGAPQSKLGYCDRYDELSPGIGFNIHGIKLVLDNNVVLRLWKGFYDFVIGGEIGFYGGSRTITVGELLGLVKEAMQDFCAKLGIQYSGAIRSLPPGTDATEELKPEAVLQELIEMVIGSDKTTTLITPPVNKNKITGQLRAWLLELIQTPGTLVVAPASLQDVLPPEGFIFFPMMAESIRRIKMLLEELKKWTLSQKFDTTFGHSLSADELREYLGLTGTVLQVYLKKNNKLITEHWERGPRFWTTTFVPIVPVMDYRLLGYNIVNIKQEIYTVNHFSFENSERADQFRDKVLEALKNAILYSHNNGEPICIDSGNGTTVIVIYGKQL